MNENSWMKDSKVAPSGIPCQSVDRACSRTNSGFCGTLSAPVTLRATFPLTRASTVSRRHLGAQIYCTERICGEKHKDCGCRCCTTYVAEAASDCFECRKFQTVADLIREYDTGVEGPQLTCEGLDIYFPRKFRPIAQAQAQGSHFDFTF